MTTFWICVLVGFLVFIVVNAIRGRRYSDAVYRARFKNRIPNRPAEKAANDPAFIVTPVVMSTVVQSPPPASTDCSSSAGDAGGSCGSGS